MRAASRETYAIAAEKLDGIAASGEPTALATIGDELLAVSGLLEREPRLRRALSDPARSPGDRRELLDGLLAGKVGENSRTLLADIAGGRWSSATELLDGVEGLGVEALLASADRSGELGDVEDELFRFGQIVDGSPELAAVLADPTVPFEQRASLIDGLLGGRARPVTVRLAKVALAGFGGRTFVGALSRLVELAAAQRDKQVAYVTVAKTLSEAEEERLTARLKALYGRDVSLKVIVDPAVLGGMRVQVGSDLYDGTTLRRLSDTRHALAGK